MTLTLSLRYDVLALLQEELFTAAIYVEHNINVELEVAKILCLCNH